MEKLLPTTRFDVTSGTMMKFFDDKVALTHIQTKRLHVLNATAAFIWKLICEGKTRQQINDLISQQYEIHPDDISTEIDGILLMLKKEELISPRS